MVIQGAYNRFLTPSKTHFTSQEAWVGPEEIACSHQLEVRRGRAGPETAAKAWAPPASVRGLMSSRQVRSASRSQLASPGGPYLSRLLVGPSHQETRLKGAGTGKMALEVPDRSGSLHTESLED